MHSCTMISPITIVYCGWVQIHAYGDTTTDNGTKQKRMNTKVFYFRIGWDLVSTPHEQVYYCLRNARRI